MSVVSQAEYGRRGYEALLAKYGTAQLNRWRRRGGRKPNPTLAEIEATEAALRRERRGKSKRGSALPS